MSDLKKACELVARTLKELAPEGPSLDFFISSDAVEVICEQRDDGEPGSFDGAHRCWGKTLYEAIEELRRYKTTAPRSSP